MQNEMRLVDKLSDILDKKPAEKPTESGEETMARFMRELGGSKT